MRESARDPGYTTVFILEVEFALSDEILLAVCKSAPISLLALPLLVQRAQRRLVLLQVALTMGVIAVLLCLVALLVSVVFTQTGFPSIPFMIRFWPGHHFLLLNTCVFSCCSNLLAMCRWKLFSLLISCFVPCYMPDV